LRKHQQSLDREGKSGGLDKVLQESEGVSVVEEGTDSLVYPVHLLYQYLHSGRMDDWNLRK
jgi:hypothetical protein